MKKLTFYTHPKSRGMSVAWMLRECGVTFDTVLIPFGEEMKSADYLAVNPMGKVPALKADGTVITEAAAILTFLAEQFPERNLIPAAGSLARGEYYRWLCFAINLEYAAFDRLNQIPSNAERRKTIGYGDLDTAFGVLRDHLARHDFIVVQPIFRAGHLLHHAAHAVHPRAPRGRQPENEFTSFCKAKPRHPSHPHRLHSF